MRNNNYDELVLVYYICGVVIIEDYGLIGFDKNTINQNYMPSYKHG